MLFSLLFSNPALFIIYLLAFAVSITVHEFSHVLSAYLQGDETGKEMGRLTLNPLAHLDPMGTLMLLFLPLGWGKPAPYNPYNLRDHRYGPLRVALAGPFSNLIMVIVFGTALHFVYPAFGSDNLLTLFLQVLVILNVVLLLFNIIPVAPLDGSSIAQILLQDRYPEAWENLRRYGPTVLFGLVILSWVGNVPIFSALFNPALGFVQHFFGVPLGF